MRTGRSSPDPGRGTAIELAGGKLRRLIDLLGIGKALAGKCLSPEEPPPSLNEIQPAGASRNRLLMDSGMLAQPLRNRATGVAGEAVGDEVELADRVRCVDGIEQLEEPASRYYRFPSSKLTSAAFLNGGIQRDGGMSSPSASASMDKL
jgi:hypothetical protein